jgi:hypothetical protein
MTYHKRASFVAGLCNRIDVVSPEYSIDPAPSQTTLNHSRMRTQHIISFASVAALAYQCYNYQPEKGHYGIKTVHL